MTVVRAGGGGWRAVATLGEKVSKKSENKKTVERKNRKHVMKSRRNEVRKSGIREDSSR